SQRLASLPSLRIPLAILVVACVPALLLPSQPFWENDLSTLTPVPRDLLLRDEALRSELGTADVRYLLVVEAPNDSIVRARLEALDGELNALVARGAMRGFDHIAK